MKQNSQFVQGSLCLAFSNIYAQNIPNEYYQNEVHFRLALLFSKSTVNKLFNEC